MDVYEVPVPERFLPLVYRVLADAYEGESGTQADVLEPSGATPSGGGSPTEWTKEEVMRAYRESTPKQRIAFDYLADHPEPKEVTSTELARVVYPNDDEVDARNKLYGLLGAFGTRSYKYGKQEWFFTAERERNPDGSAGRMVYIMPAEEAAWLREASGRE